MNTAVAPMQYLDKAMSRLHDLGLLPEKQGEEAPIIALLNQISDLDEERVVAITRTLSAVRTSSTKDARASGQSNQPTKRKCSTRARMSWNRVSFSG